MEVDSCGNQSVNTDANTKAVEVFRQVIVPGFGAVMSSITSGVECCIHTVRVQELFLRILLLSFKVSQYISPEDLESILRLL